jgi:two-component system CheB/CheR fusion protein
VARKDSSSDVPPPNPPILAEQSAAPATKVRPALDDINVDTNADVDVSTNETLPFPVVGVGASTGGLEAFSQILRALPADLGMAFVFLQHAEPAQGSMLVEILSHASSMQVQEAQDGATLKPNTVYVIPPGASMLVSGGQLKASQRREPRTPHRPIDQFFRSLADDQRHRAIGIVLSGSASDASLGMQELTVLW